MDTDHPNQNVSSSQNNKSKSWWKWFWGEGDANVSVEHKIHLGTWELKFHSRTLKALSSIGSIAFLLCLLFSFVSQVKSALRSPPDLPPRIDVFVPDSNRASENAFYQDGAIQRKGFEKAKLDAEDLPNHLYVEFHSIKKEDSPEAILAEMKNAYSSNGATFFVMTMSKKVAGIKNHFANWHDACVRNGKREPVLVATVASAPNLADASAGIVRWYVRSEDESAILAEYLRWKEGVTNAVVFYICSTAGQSDDAYGSSGRELFQTRFLSLGGTLVGEFNVTAGTARNDVKSFLLRYKSRQEPPLTGAFIVGYGDMVRETINELVAQGFKGPIVCASTLTEPDWQPQDKSADSRIFTVLPRQIGAQARLHGDDRNVVFFFSKMTLARVLELTAKNSDSRKFIERWKAQDKGCDLDQDYLANGDIMVNLNVVGADEWR